MQHLVDVLIVGGEPHVIRHLALGLERRWRHYPTYTELLGFGPYLLHVLQRILELSLRWVESWSFD
jgi:hypothetical protein